MRFDKTFSVGIECVCGAKLDAVLVDSDKYDIVIVVENTHICPAAQQSVQQTTLYEAPSPTEMERESQETAAEDSAKRRR